MYMRGSSPAARYDDAVSTGATIESRYVPPSAAVAGVIALLLTVAAAVSLFLFTRALAGVAAPGCGPGSGCDAVLGSSWAKVLGVPVSLPAVLVDVAVLLALWNALVGRTAARRRAAWKLVIAGAFVVIGAAAWFIVLQLAVLRAVCPWCMAAHVAGSAGAVVALAVAPVGRVRLTDDEPADPMVVGPGRAGGLAAAGLLLVALLAGVQWALPADQMRVMVFGGLVGRPTDTPILGDPDAPHLVLSMYDYTCPHCRVMHGYQAELLRRHGDELAIVAMPVPLEAKCNGAADPDDPHHRGACELAATALAVWRADPGAFVAFEDWLFEPVTPREPAAARAEAARRVGGEKLNAALADPWVQQQIEANVALYRATQAGALPRMMSGGSVLVGRAASAEELIRTVREALGLP